MGFFSFIENFFFVTLAITFVLILLLVYHFKQRINYTEEKMEKMFEIVNNIVKELGAVKNIALRNHLGENLGFPEGIVQKVPLFDNITFAINNQHVNENTRNSHTPFEIIEEEDEDEDEDEELPFGCNHCSTKGEPPLRSKALALRDLALCMPPALLFLLQSFCFFLSDNKRMLVHRLPCFVKHASTLVEPPLNHPLPSLDRTANSSSLSVMEQSGEFHIWHSRWM